MKEVQLAHNSRQAYYLIQIGIGAAFVLITWLLFRAREPGSGFKVREADRLAHAKRAAGGPDLGSQKQTRNTPLQLTGIRIDGAPHEILGVPANATPKQVQDAYLLLMKRFHPDRVGPPGSREWQDAQKIATAINQARKKMLERK